MLLVGVIWIVVMTYICYRGIEVSANFQKVLLGIEIIMLLVHVGDRAGQGVDRATRPGRCTPSFGWLLPTHITASRHSSAASS